MTITEIKSAINDGKLVCWKNEMYQVTHTNDSWDIVCVNGSVIGLTSLNEELNGNEEDFYIYDEINEFVKYFLEFYGKDGIYPMDNLTIDDIKKGINIRIDTIKDIDFIGDSFDRETIKNIIDNF